MEIVNEIIAALDQCDDSLEWARREGDEDAIAYATAERQRFMELLEQEVRNFTGNYD